MEIGRMPKLCDVANLILGAVLFVFAWIFGFTPEEPLETPSLAASSSRRSRSRRFGIRGLGGSG